MALVTALVQTAPKVMDSLKNLLKNLIQAVLNVCKSMYNAWIKLFENAITAIGSEMSGIISKAGAVVTGAIDKVKSFATSMYNAAKEVFSKVVSAIGDKISDVTSKVGELGTAAKNKLSNFISSFSSIGGQLISGLWSGISDKAQWLYDKITGMGSTVVSKVKKLFGIKSPSKVFAEIGNYLAEGLGVGWEDGMVDVMDDIEADLKIPDAEINANTIGELTYQVGDLEANNQTEQLNAILGILTTYLPECSAGLNIDGEKLTNSLNRSLGLAVL
jgi:phage-related protein